MHIFIDESGLFSTEPNLHAWSTVGGVAIPDGSLNKVAEALENLKNAHGVELSKEFKRDRPDCASEPYQEFLKKLDSANCTLYVLSTRSSPAEAVALKKHRSATIEAIRNYAKKVTDAASHAEEVICLIESLSQQEYNQCVLQSQMISDMLPKMVSYYAGVLPTEIGRFKWVVDRKNIAENRYERSFKELYIGLVSVRSKRQTSSLLAGRDYSVFSNAFSPNENVEVLLKRSKEMFEIDHTHLAGSAMPVSFGALLQNEFSLEDSKNSVGIQVSDLLISSVNRCLKQNYTDNNKMAKALGKLMVNAPRIEEQSLKVFGHGPAGPLDKVPAKLIELMDESSKQLYGGTFRANFSKNFPCQ
ncbi:DUF3800 domain-containing protein [Pseudomonas sp. 'CRE Jenny 4']|uniref:DUF3800 domain-containing protein n=1 Tax=Pseudomonas sp. 'CRE Jenny 4' TaxID=3045817 RepID=UPI0025A197FE|nr:DUF3800 domain-containing protein [Pseudomonas sp. 'CRE Jenny 4']